MTFMKARPAASGALLRWLSASALALGLLAAPSAAKADATVVVESGTYADTDPSALSDFHDPLAPYGTWVVDPTYGTVWVPSVVVVGPDFAPYQTAGHWEMTDEGEWLWVSDYEWGYIPFHYGRWVWIGGRGWAWIPGRVYAPAWVVWRTSDYGYIGWAPAPPTYVWMNGAAVGLWFTPRVAYTFCPSRYVFHRHVHTYVVRDRRTVHSIAHHSRPYTPAQPKAVGPASGASAGTQKSRPFDGRPRGPSLDEAKIPADVRPKALGRPDARALALATREGTAKAKAAPGGLRGAAAGPLRRGAAGSSRALPSGRPGLGAASRPPRVAPSPRSPAPRPGLQRPAPSRIAPLRPSAPTRIAPSRPSAPRFGAPSAPSAPTRVAPSRPSAPRFSPAPSRPAPRVAPSRPSAPRFSPAPSRPSAPRFSPAPSRSRFSAPSPSRGRSFAPRGGGFGGRRR